MNIQRLVVLTIWATLFAVPLFAMFHFQRSCVPNAHAQTQVPWEFRDDSSLSLTR